MKKQPDKKLVGRPEDCPHFGYILRGGQYICITCGQLDQNNKKGG